MAKTSRFKYQYRKNASKLHRAVGDVLRSKSFANYQAYQEYPVNKVNPRFSSGAHKFDWVVPALKVVIECHGRQHYEVATFGAEVEDAIQAFRDTQARDETKKNAALAAGWRYVVVSYREMNKVTPRLIFDKIKEAETELGAWKLEHYNDTDEIPTTHELAKERQQARTRQQRRKYLGSDAHRRNLERARQARQEQYRRLKELKDGRR